VPFSVKDSKAIESAFQSWSDEEDASDREKLTRGSDIGDGSDDIGVSSEGGTKLRKSGVEETSSVKVPVNEDYLFDVDVERRELAPTYWLGPVYDVRRGTWFFQGMFACTLIFSLNTYSIISSLEATYARIADALNDFSPYHNSLVIPFLLLLFSARIRQISKYSCFLSRACEAFQFRRIN
jgi:hypothetical protein